MAFCLSTCPRLSLICDQNTHDILYTKRLRVLITLEVDLSVFGIIFGPAIIFMATLLSIFDKPSILLLTLINEKASIFSAFHPEKILSNMVIDLKWSYENSC